MIALIALSIPVSATYAVDEDTERFCTLVQEMSENIALGRALGQTKQQLFESSGINNATYSILTSKLFKAIANLAYSNKMTITNEVHAEAFGIVLYDTCIKSGGISF